MILCVIPVMSGVCVCVCVYGAPSVCLPLLVCFIPCEAVMVRVCVCVCVCDWHSLMAQDLCVGAVQSDG